MNFTSRKKVSRRAVLRGVGVSMALPWLDAMSPDIRANSGRSEPSPLRVHELGAGIPRAEPVSG